MKKMTRIIQMFLMSVAIFFVMGIDVSADMGPKESITVEVKNAPEDYYIALLSGEDESSDSEGTDNSLHVDSFDAGSIREYLGNFSENGWAFYESPVGDNVYYSKDFENSWINEHGKNTFGFHYMVPRTFKIILITSDGNVHLSNAVTTGEFNSFVIYDYNSGVLKTHEYGKKILRFIKSLVRLVLTLLMEFSIFKSYGYAEVNLNIFHFIFINAVTQIYMYLNVFRYHAGGWPWIVLIIMCEIVVFGIEALYLGVLLRNPDGSFSLKKNLECSIMSNLASCFGGALIALVFYLVLGMLRGTIIYNYLS